MTYISFLPGKKHGGNNPEFSDDLNAFDDAGYLLTPSDLVVDIDSLDHEQLKALIDTFDIKTQVVWTDRGAHLYFKKPLNFRGSKSPTALGVEVEYKHTSNTKATTIKRNGVAREITNEGQRQMLPEYFKPDRKANVLLGMEEGEGRNKALFDQRRHIEKMVPQWRKVVRYINNHVFASPLLDNELSTVMRDLAPSEQEQNGESVLAGIIMRDLKTVKYNGQIFFKHQGNYTTDDDLLHQVIFNYAIGEKMPYVEEVFKQISYRSHILPPDTTFDIKFKNGILRRGEFIEIEYDDFTPYSIDIDYNPQAKRVAAIDNYIDQLTNNETEYRKLLMEMLGYTLIVDKEKIRSLGKFFIMVGGGGNGKGTLLTIIRTIIGRQNSGSLSIKELTDERYLNSLQDKLVNLGDDIDNSAINDEMMKQLKNISTADYISVRRLYSNSVSMELTTKLIFTSNHIIKSFEKGYSYKRRVLFLPMYTEVKKADPNFITRLTTPEALEYWVKLIVEGYERLYSAGEFTKSPIVDEFNKQYHEENNNVDLYLSQLEASDVIGKRAPEVYEDYETWAEENGEPVQSRRLLKEAILNNLHCDAVPTRSGKKVARLYQLVKEEETTE